MILTPTSMEVRPAKLTRANAVRSSPTWIGSLKSTLSTDTVTHGFRREPAGHDFLGLHATDQVIQNPVDLVIADAVVALGGLPGHEIGRGRLAEDLLGHADVARQRPHLRLEQVAQRVHGGRIVRMPREVAEQALGLVARAE